MSAAKSAVNLATCAHRRSGKTSTRTNSAFSVTDRYNTEARLADFGVGALWVFYRAKEQ